MNDKITLEKIFEITIDESNKFDIKDWYNSYYNLKRQFTVKTEKICEVLILDLHSCNAMST